MNYVNLRALDAVCTCSTSLIGRLIRLRSASLADKNGIKEMFRNKLANHVGLIVEMDGRYWIAEMLGEGLKINSLNNYIGKKDNQIVAIKRLRAFDNDNLRLNANEFVIAAAQETLKYDWDGILEFLGLCKDNPQQMYCSELAEVVANKYNATWDKWQLTRHGKKSRIAPCEIQHGSGIDVEWMEQ